MTSFIEFVIQREIDECVEIIVENQLQLDEGALSWIAKGVAPYIVDKTKVGSQQASALGRQGGAMAGAALGSVVPGLGTALGTAVGGAVGDVVGRGVGRQVAIKGIENIGKRGDQWFANKFGNLGNRLGTFGDKVKGAARAGRSLLGREYLNNPDFVQARKYVVNLIGSLKNLASENPNYNSILQNVVNLKKQLVTAAKQKNMEVEPTEE